MLVMLKCSESVVWRVASWAPAPRAMPAITKVSLQIDGNVPLAIA